VNDFWSADGYPNWSADGFPDWSADGYCTDAVPVPDPRFTIAMLARLWSLAFEPGGAVLTWLRTLSVSQPLPDWQAESAASDGVTASPRQDNAVLPPPASVAATPEESVEQRARNFTAHWRDECP
jgi:hypothetical protein